MIATHFYGELSREDGPRFLREAGRVGRDLVVVDAAVREEVEAEEWQ